MPSPRSADAAGRVAQLRAQLAARATARDAQRAEDARLTAERRTTLAAMPDVFDPYVEPPGPSQSDLIWARAATRARSPNNGSNRAGRVA